MEPGGGRLAMVLRSKSVIFPTGNLVLRPLGVFRAAWGLWLCFLTGIPLPSNSVVVKESSGSGICTSRGGEGAKGWDTTGNGRRWSKSSSQRWRGTMGGAFKLSGESWLLPERVIFRFYAFPKPSR